MIPWSFKNCGSEPWCPPLDDSADEAPPRVPWICPPPTALRLVMLSFGFDRDEIGLLDDDEPPFSTRFEFEFDCRDVNDCRGDGGGCFDTVLDCF